MAKCYTIFFALLFVVVIAACNSPSKVPLKEFEGIITYKTSRTTWRDSNRTPHTSDTIRIYYSHGNMCKVHTSDSAIIKKEIYITKGNHYYFLKPHIDTLFYYDVAQTIPHTELASLSMTDADTTILGHDCQKADIWIRHQGEKGPFYTEYQYLFSNDYLVVNPEHWTKYNFGYFNKMIDRAGHYYLGFHYKLHTYDNVVIETTDYAAINIKEQKIDPNVFNLDKLPLKELNLR
jgi:hypothetical protein